MIALGPVTTQSMAWPAWMSMGGLDTSEVASPAIAAVTVDWATVGRLKPKVCEPSYPGTKV